MGRYGLPRIKLPKLDVGGKVDSAKDVLSAGAKTAVDIATVIAPVAKDAGSTVAREALSGTKYVVGETVDASKYVTEEVVGGTKYVVEETVEGTKDIASWTGGQFDTIKWFPIIIAAGAGLLLYSSRKEIASVVSLR